MLVLAGAIIGTALYKAAATGTGNQLPMPFGIGSAVVQSGSMEPTYKKGDLLFIKTAEEYAVGDVVVYQGRSILVVHRIVAIDGDAITAKGDANNVADEPIDRSAIKGKVAASIPFVGLVVDGIKSPIGIIVILALLFLIIESSYRRERNKVKERDEIRVIKEEIERLKKEKKDKEAGAAE